MFEAEGLALQAKDKLSLKEAREWTLSGELCPSLSYAFFLCSLMNSCNRLCANVAKVVSPAVGLSKQAGITPSAPLQGPSKILNFFRHRPEENVGMVCPPAASKSTKILTLTASCKVSSLGISLSTWIWRPPSSRKVVVVAPSQKHETVTAKALKPTSSEKGQKPANKTAPKVNATQSKGSSSILRILRLERKGSKTQHTSGTPLGLQRVPTTSPPLRMMTTDTHL